MRTNPTLSLSSPAGAECPWSGLFGALENVALLCRIPPTVRGCFSFLMWITSLGDVTEAASPKDHETLDN